MDKNDVIEYVMHTPHNTNKAVLSSMLNQLAEGGGGGSSDFSTAEVTVDLQSNKFYFMLPFADDTSGSSLCRIAQSGTYKAILYTNMSVGITAASGGGLLTVPAITVTGDAEQIGTGEVRITGDCTITIS